jgi:hypothetical protein
MPLPVSTPVNSLRKAFVLSVHVTNFAATNANVTSRYVGIGTNVALQFGHEAWQKRITSLSDFPFGSKSEPPLPPPIGKVVKAVFENLFESQEFQNTQVNSWVKAQATFVRANGAVHLDTETTVDLDFAVVVDPRYTEHDYTLWFNHALKDFCVLYFGFSSMKGINDSTTS